MSCKVANAPCTSATSELAEIHDQAYARSDTRRGEVAGRQPRNVLLDWLGQPGALKTVDSFGQQEVALEHAGPPLRDPRNGASSRSRKSIASPALCARHRDADPEP